MSCKLYAIAYIIGIKGQLKRKMRLNIFIILILLFSHSTEIALALNNIYLYNKFFLQTLLYLNI